MGFAARQGSTNPIDQVGINRIKGRPRLPIRVGCAACSPPCVLSLPVALAAAPAADARPARDIAAVAVHPWQMLDSQSRERTFDGIAAAGVRWVRIDLPWSWVERRDPAQNGGHRDWSRLDPIVDAATRHGLRVIAVMGYVPPWASATGDLWTYPKREPFEAFYAAALRHWPQIAGLGAVERAQLGALLEARRPTPPGSSSSCAAPGASTTGVGSDVEADLRRRGPVRRRRRERLARRRRDPRRAEADRRLRHAPLQRRRAGRPALLDDAAARRCTSGSASWGGPTCRSG